MSTTRSVSHHNRDQEPDRTGVHANTLQVQVGLKSNDGMELIPIGEAAALLGLSTSALRYYDERGLVRPSGRQGSGANSSPTRCIARPIIRHANASR
jgi:MerR family regulatory protein